MPVQKKINGQLYFVNEDEYNIINHKEYNNLKIIENLGIHERLIGLINKLFQVFDGNYFFSIDTQFGGFIPLNLSYNFKEIVL